jgi:hypothetical protein
LKSEQYLCANPIKIERRSRTSCKIAVTLKIF